MNQRALGTTGISVSEVGLGAWQLGNAMWSNEDIGNSVRIVAAALDLGCTFFDTAPGYGEGRSEEILGAALAGRRAEVVISTKFGHTAEGTSDFSAAALVPALQASMRRLRTDYLDVVLLHNPEPNLLQQRYAEDLYAALEEAKTAGMIRAYGASVDWSADLRQVVEQTASGAAEILFNALHQEPKNMFPAAAKRGVGLIAKVPLDSGWLTGKYDATSTFDGIRERWTPEVVARRASLVAEFRAFLPEGTSMLHGALRYVLARPEISSVIPGAKSVEQLTFNMAAAAEPLPASTVTAIDAWWAKTLQTNPVPW